jgi:VanZ family protein
MRTDRFACLVIAGGIMLGLLFVSSHPVPAGWDKAAHMSVFALITALVLYGTEARAPLAVLGAVVGFAALDEMHQLIMPGRSAEMLDFVADAVAAAAVCSALLIRRKPICVELSQP